MLVLGSLALGMTLTSALLLSLEPGRVAPMTGVVDVVIGARIRSRVHVAALAGRVNAPSPGRERTLRLILALRSGAGGRGW